MKNVFEYVPFTVVFDMNDMEFESDMQKWVRIFKSIEAFYNPKILEAMNYGRAGDGQGRGTKRKWGGVAPKEPEIINEELAAEEEDEILNNSMDGDLRGSYTPKGSKVLVGGKGSVTENKRIGLNEHKE
jgi:hypothetical protein